MNLDTWTCVRSVDFYKKSNLQKDAQSFIQEEVYSFSSVSNRLAPSMRSNIIWDEVRGPNMGEISSSRYGNYQHLISSSLTYMSMARFIIVIITITITIIIIIWQALPLTSPPSPAPVLANTNHLITPCLPKDHHEEEEENHEYDPKI